MSINPMEWDLDLSSDPFIWNRFDPSWSLSTLLVLYEWPRLGPSILWTALDLWWGLPTLWISHGFCDHGCVRPFYGPVMTLGGICPFCGLVRVWPWLGPSILWNVILTLGGVRPLCGLIKVWPHLGPSILWTVILTLGGVCPLCGLISLWPWLGSSILWTGLDPWWDPSTL